MTSRVGIQLKPDHPAFWRTDAFGNRVRRYPVAPPSLVKAEADAAERVMRTFDVCLYDLAYVLEAFSRAYSFTLSHAEELLAAGKIAVEDAPDGSVYVYFVSSLSEGEAGAALRAMGRLGL